MPAIDSTFASCCWDPSNQVAIWASTLMPQIGEILKKIIVTDDEVRNHDAR